MYGISETTSCHWPLPSRSMPVASQLPASSRPVEKRAAHAD
jgi:hypothetical protein